MMALPRPRPRGSGRCPRRAALQGFDVLLDLPVDIHVLGEVPIEIGKPLRRFRTVGCGFRPVRVDLRIQLGELAPHLGDHVQHVLHGGLGHRPQRTHAHRQGARKGSAPRELPPEVGDLDARRARR